MMMEGVLGLVTTSYTDHKTATSEMKTLSDWIMERKSEFEGIVQVIIHDDFVASASALNDYVWITYTRSNPSHDVYGVDEFTENKHWGCRGPMIIDARKKPHHAPELKVAAETEKSIERFFKKGGPLERWA
jgi:4-hydroxy-3-polyprenylbenzoate decarboxylase